jgi:hypothetical protein
LVQRCREVCSALAALHACGLVHRDVAPANVVLEGAEDACPWLAPARLLDYGLVRAAHTQVSAPLGTRGYAAPELLTTGEVDARTDVFGIGAMLHDLVTGSMPRDASVATARQRVQCDRLATGGKRNAVAPRTANCTAADVPADVDPRLRDLAEIVARCVAPDPAARYRDAAALGADLDAWLAERPGPSQARRIRIRRRVRRAAFVALGVAVGAVLSVWLWQLVHVHRLFARGAVLRADAALAAWPLRWTRALAPALLLHRSPSAAAATDAPSALAAVLDAGRDSDEDALLHAARYLERDGPMTHRELLRFLHWAIASPDRSAQARGDALRLAGRLFHERPIRTASETAVTQHLATELARRLLEPPTSQADAETAAWACTALAGCGGSAEFSTVVTAVRVAAFPAADTLELAVRAVRGILRRAHACEFADELDPDRVATTVRSLSATDRLVLLSPGGRDWLWVETAFFLRRAGRSPLALLDDLAAPTPLVRAAAGDPSLAAALTAGPAVPVDHNEAAAYGVFQDYGRCAGAFGDDGLARIAGTAARTAATLRGLDVAMAERVFAQAHDELRALRLGAIDFDSPDADTHLAVGLRLPGLVLAPIPHVPDGEPGHARMLATWRLWSTPAELGGTARAVHGRAVTFPAEELRPGRCFARLGVFGVSELAFDFTCSDSTLATAWSMAMQKGIRSGLPRGGSAQVEIWLDDRRVSIVPVDGATRESLQLPLGVLASGPHRIRVVLHGESTTTVRVLEARLDS